ncbi:uncharacterized protein LOC112348991 [Selaginella moellendorffii]|uniref:uncharacterized protein LOC112348991 n=1 Tax=Selaginella moellendorffii TaxID=88036 RepID=UPI000D1D114E|nr:uncharacterized protein LOC112348991 [Selaginella moellendorffii]|eukprot:XP_024538298.1 uncharacterized protein LOC112348991 [Selaginella moellendorffii]
MIARRMAWPPGAGRFSGVSISSTCARSVNVALARRSSQQAITVSSEEVWKFWQFGGLSLDAIAEKIKSPRGIVVDHLVAAIDGGKPVDWIALCKEVNLNLSAANEVSKYLPRTRQIRTGAYLDKISSSCSKVTREQLQLCSTMLDRGFSFDDIRAVAAAETGYSANELETLRAVSAELQKSRKIKKEFFRVSQGKVVLLDQGLVDLLRDRDGASLLEIAAFFSDCDQKQLVDLLYELEKAGTICSTDGKYREVHMPIF